MELQILDQLQDASWRDIAFPFTGVRDHGFQQEQAQHRFLFRDEQLIESIGKQNPTFRYSIPFREAIRQHGWKNLFTVVYPKFYAACVDRTAGDLVDPIHGLIRAKCVSLSESLDVTRRDGVDIVAEFIFAPEDPDQVASQFGQIAQSLQGLEVSAVQFGDAVRGLTPEQRREFESLNRESTEAEQSVFDAARSTATSVQQYKERTRAVLGQASFQMEQTRSEVERAQDPELELLRRDSSRFALASRNLSRTIGDPVTPFEVLRVSAEIGRLAFATSYQITVEALIELNAGLANQLTIPAGTRVRVPRRNS